MDRSGCGASARRGTFSQRRGNPGAMGEGPVGTVLGRESASGSESTDRGGRASFAKPLYGGAACSCAIWSGCGRANGRQEIEAEEREQHTAAALTAARQHLEKGQQDAAIQVLRDALLRNPGHSGLTALLAETSAISEAEAALAGNQFQKALGIVAAALAVRPGEETLLKLRARIESRSLRLPSRMPFREWKRHWRRISFNRRWTLSRRPCLPIRARTRSSN